ncbi:hypothetical protein LPJ75_004126 [Coemansia sp. RSA 2598]|nr:hypothetical protein LPJ75_004126 [Coemansia sp. RSA 2598]
MRSSVSSILRDFGRDDGGQWVAIVPDGLHVPVDYEITPGTQLTEAELARGSVSIVEGSPHFVAPPESAYAPIPGLSRIQDPGHNDSATGHRAAELPSRALANELVFNLLHRIAPEIRRLPGLESFEFASATPEYLSQSTPDPVGAAGAGLSALGDAFVEIGRALQTVGGQWRNADSTPAEAAYSPDHMLSLVQAISNAVSAVSVATPFLRSTPVQLARSRTVPWEDSRDRESGSGDGAQDPRERGSSPSRRTRYLVANASQRNYRRIAQSMLMLNGPRAPEDRPSPTGTRPTPIETSLRSLNANFSTLGNAFDRILAPGGTMHGDSLMRRWQRQWQRRLGQQRRSARQLPAHLWQSSQSNDASSEGTGARDNVDTGASSGDTTTNNSNNSNHSNTSNSNDGNSNDGNSNDSNSALLGEFASALEERISHILRGHGARLFSDQPVEIELEAIAVPGVGFHILNNLDSNHPSASGPAETQSQDRDPPQTDSTRSHARADALGGSDAGDIPPVADMHRSGSPDSGAFVFVDRASAMGSQTARSDRSNMSTTTEYSTNNGPSSRFPRILNFGGANGFGSQMPGFASIANPFPLASVFLGTESSSASTTRRTSISSNPSRPAGGDDASSSSGVDVSAAASMDASQAQPSQSLASQQQVGSTRPRSVSFLNVSHGDDYEAGAASENSSYSRGSRGSSKRHKTRSGENSENEDDDGNADGQ